MRTFAFAIAICAAFLTFKVASAQEGWANGIIFCDTKMEVIELLISVGEDEENVDVPTGCGITSRVYVKVRLLEVYEDETAIVQLVEYTILFPFSFAGAVQYGWISYTEKEVLPTVDAT